MGRVEKRELSRRANLKGVFKQQVKKIEQNLKEMESQRFQSGDSVYDITALTTLLRASLGYHDLVPSYVVAGIDIAEEVGKKDFTEAHASIPMVGVILKDLLENYKDCGFIRDIEKAKYIGEVEGLYDGVVGGCNLDVIYGDIVGTYTTGYKLNIEEEGKEELFSEVTLSGLYAVLLDFYTLCGGGDYVKKGGGLRKAFGVWLGVLQTLQPKPLLEVYKCLCSYVVRDNLKEGVKYKEVFRGVEISGDVIKDVIKYGGDEYLYILDVLKVGCEEEEVEEEWLGNSLYPYEREALQTFDIVQLSMLHNFVYNYMVLNIKTTQTECKREVEQLEKRRRKEVSKLEKQIKKIERDSKAKQEKQEKELKKLRSEKGTVLEVKKEYEEQIEELSQKIKSLEAKNETAKQRIMKLEQEREQAYQRKEQERRGLEYVAIEEEGRIEEEKKEKSIEEKYEEVKLERVLILGGTSKWFNRVKERYENAIHIAVEESSKFALPKKVEKGIIVASQVRHCTVNRARGMEGVEWYYINGLQIDEITEVLYKSKEKREG